MAAGTIALTNGSTTISGTGTSFTTQLKVGDFVYVTVGGAPYTLVAASIVSDTQLTLAVAFDGPTTSGLAWNFVPASLQVAITQKILNDFASVARGRILDFQNWQKIYSDAASVTVTRPDRTQFTGPSWGYIATQLSNKFDKAGGDISGNMTVEGKLKISGLTRHDSHVIIKAGMALSYADPASPDTAIGMLYYSPNDNTVGLGNNISKLQFNSSSDVISNQEIGSVRDLTFGAQHFGGMVKGMFSGGRGSWAGGDARGAYIGLMPYENSSSQSACGLLRLNGYGSQYDWQFGLDGIARSPVSNGWQAASDERVKGDIQAIENPLDIVRACRGATWTQLTKGANGKKGVGLIIQELLPFFSFIGDSKSPVELDDGTFVDDCMSMDTGAVGVAVLWEAVKALIRENEGKDTIIEELKERMKAIDGLDA